MEQFIYNEEIFHQLEKIIQKATNPSKVKVAVAYLGKGGAEILPLSKGHTLVVNLTPTTAACGATNPIEIKKLIRRGVQVYYNSRLHAKVYVAGQMAIVASANVSKNATDYLEEAAIVTSNSEIVESATAYISELAKTKVTTEYLKDCIDTYQKHLKNPKSPSLIDSLMTKKQGKRSQRITVESARLWIIRTFDCQLDQKVFELAENKTLSAKKKYSTESLSYIYRKSISREIFKSIREGDWVVQIIDRGRNTVATAPARVMGVVEIKRKGIKPIDLLFYEDSNKRSIISLAKFRDKIKKQISQWAIKQPKIYLVDDKQKIGFILRLWRSPKAK